jgi:hypothetical protein
MPTKVLEHICYEGTIIGGPYDQHRISVSGSREGRKYVPSVTVMGPDGFYLPANPLEIPSATLRVSKESPRAALDVAFKSLYFYLNNTVAAARIKDVQEKSKHWVMLDDMGKRDYTAMPAYDSKEYEEFQAQEFAYVAPNSEAVQEAGLMSFGSSASIEVGEELDGSAEDASGQSKGTEEDEEGVSPGAESSVDGNMAADKGLQNFLKSSAGLKPELSSSQGVGTDLKG